MSRYVDALGAVSPSARGAKRVAEIVAALTPPPKPEAMAGDINPTVVQVQPVKTDSAGATAMALAPGAIGAVVGAMTWKQHRVLGFLLGHAVGATALPIIRGGTDRKRALCQLGVEGAGVGGALWMKDHPIWGYLLGVTAGAVVTSFVPGSAASEMYSKWKGGK